MARSPGATMISIVMPTYNCAAYLGDAIASCVGQSRREGWELIVVDDGSTDDTPSVLAKYRDDPRVHVVRQANAGSAAARNTAIERAAGEFLAFLDADDWYHPQTIARFLATIPRLPESVGLVYGDYTRIEAGGSPDPVTVRAPLRRPRLLWQYLLPKWFPVLTSTVLARREAVLEAGGFDPAFRMLQDIELWTRMIPNWDTAKISGCVAYRRMRPGQATENRPLIKSFRERCNVAFLERHPFSMFSGVEDPAANARLAEHFGDLFLNDERPLPLSAAACYRIARSFAPPAAGDAQLADKIAAAARVGDDA